MQQDGPNACPGCGTRPSAEVPADGIGRRTFLVQSAILAAAAALAACGAGGSVTAPTLSGSTSIKVSDYPALASVGGVALVNVSGSPLAIVHSDASTYLALSRVCPHQGSIVNFTGNGFLCPNHGARFTETGTWVGGQPTTDMRSYPTSFDSTTGTLTIG
ncbi:MAG TPA: Rieske (2Fe-2S) protein [Gemmatimonadaceae bacterium]|nr:Rieske (2Fe-2S) protein [Gemmatimonadaceae bacterium]